LSEASDLWPSTPGCRVSGAFQTMLVAGIVYAFPINSLLISENDDGKGKKRKVGEIQEIFF
jgi:hypothetical protein